MPDAVLKEGMKAAKAGDSARLAELLDSQPELIAVRDGDDTTLLHYAAWKGHVNAAELLLDRGAEIAAMSTGGHWGGTPLHAAAHANNRAVAELLIARGADVRAISGNGRTPLQETALHGASAVARLLRAHGAVD